MYKIILKPLLFLMSPENAHTFSMTMAKILVKLGLFSFFKFKSKKSSKVIEGLTFPNPIGLAAGFDKDGKYLDIISKMGFGFIELGTVTPKPQLGNPKPRLFRIPKDRAIINRMGFNNEGVDKLVERLKKFNKNDLIIGGNIGKNKVTPNELAYQDYEICFEKLFEFVDYFVVNVSSPNTPNLRALQEKEPLKNILNKLQRINKSKKSPKPIFLKIAPDLTNGQLDDIVEIVETTKISGIVATNTTISRENLTTNPSIIDQIGNGGLSGQPVKQHSTEIIRYLRNKAKNNFVIIGVGGISSINDAKEKFEAGSDLIQIFSGLIYEGPLLVKKINKSLIR